MVVPAPNKNTLLVCVCGVALSPFSSLSLLCHTPPPAGGLGGRWTDGSQRIHVATCPHMHHHRAVHTYICNHFCDGALSTGCCARRIVFCVRDFGENSGVSDSKHSIGARYDHCSLCFKES
jgi:hypothetical protein